MSKINKVPDFESMFNKIKQQAPRAASVIALNHFKDSFQKQGFTDEAFTAWDSRRGDTRPGGAILTQTGHLRDSLNISTVTKTKVEIVNSAPYASIHNEGGTLTIAITPKMRKYFWFMFGNTGESKFKFMALTKKNNMVIKMPKRQFMGDSAVMTTKFDKWMIDQISKTPIPLK